MTLAQAVKLALGCIDSEIKRLHFDANLFERFGAPHGEKNHKKRARLLAARAILAELISDPKHK